MSLHRHSVSARALAVVIALALLALLAAARIASAGPAEGAQPPRQATPAAPSRYGEEPGDVSRLPQLFPALHATPMPPAGPPSVHTSENILLLGMDARPNGKMWRTDTVMVAAVDAARGEVGILSIPRDLWVNIPGYGGGRINIVDFVGETRGGAGAGPALMSQVLEEYLGIRTQHWVRVRQEGLVGLVDAVGGITLTLDCPFMEKTPDPKIKGQYEYLMLPAGPVFLNGETAKKFVTYRYASSDFSRARRQQQVMWAIRDRAMQSDLFSAIPQLATALADTFQTDLLVGDLVELALLGRDLAPERVHGHVLSRDAIKSALIEGSAVLVIDDPVLIKEEVEGLFSSQPVAELGRSATGRCSALPTATR